MSALGASVCAYFKGKQTKRKRVGNLTKIKTSEVKKGNGEWDKENIDNNIQNERIYNVK